MVSFNLFFSGILRTNCYLSTYPECKLPMNYILFLILIIFSLILTYICVKLIRQMGILGGARHEKGIIFCIMIQLNLIINAFSYISNLHIFTDYGSSQAYQLKEIISNIELFPILIYFNEIVKILILFGFKAAKIPYYVSNVLISILGLYAFVSYIFAFFDFQSKYEWYYNLTDAFLYYKFFVKHAVYAIEYVMLCFTFIFSDIQTYLLKSRRLKLKIALFIFPFFIFLDVIQKSFYYGSVYWLRYTILRLNENEIYSSFPELKNPYFYIFWFYQCFWGFILNIIPLYIVFLLSVRKEQDDIEEKQAETELTLSLVV